MGRSIVIHRTLGGIVLAKSKERSTIRLETGETRVMTIPCLARIGDRVHVYINWSTNKVVKVSTAGCPDHWNGDVEPPPVDVPDETEDIPHLEFQVLKDQEVLGRQENEESGCQEYRDSQEYQEVLGRPGREGVGSLEFCTLIDEDNSVLDDVFEEEDCTQAGEPSHKLFKELL